MLNALVLGNYHNEMWHQFAGCDKHITKALGEAAKVTATEDYNDYSAEDFNQYNVILIHSLKFEYATRMIRELVSYVINGGGLVAFHASMLSFYPAELIQLVGAAFRMHPPFTKLVYRPKDECHPIMRGIEPFALEDEPFQFHFAELTKKHIFLSYEYEGLNYPAGWCHEYGLGRVVYLQPGHNWDTFENEMYQRIIHQSALWAAKEKHA